jgi:uncharacterized membrane protein
MKTIIKYLIIFILGSLVGWLYEYYVNKQKDSCGDTIFRKLHICVPLLTIYGLGAIILLYIKDNYKFTNIMSFSLIATFILSIFECISGKAAKYLYNVKEWDYTLDKKNICVCDGYLSLYSICLWFLVAILFYKIF